MRSQKWARTDMGRVLLDSQARCMPMKKYAVTRQRESADHDSSVAFPSKPVAFATQAAAYRPQTLPACARSRARRPPSGQ
jgi:hypothetical protein